MLGALALTCSLTDAVANDYPNGCVSCHVKGETDFRLNVLLANIGHGRGEQLPLQLAADRQAGPLAEEVLLVVHRPLGVAQALQIEGRDVEHLARALGVDEAILLSDRCFGGADTLATSNVLATAIDRLAQEEELGIVFCGKQTIDGDTAQVGPGIASRLGLQQLTLVDKIEHLDLEKKTIRVRRKLEGRHEIVEAPLPVMITTVRELNRPRYPTVPMRLAARDVEVRTWDNATLQIDPETVGLKGSPTWVCKIFSPERDQGEIIGDGVNDPDGTADLLIDKLLSKDLLAL